MSVIMLFVGGSKSGKLLQVPRLHSGIAFGRNKNKTEKYRLTDIEGLLVYTLEGMTEEEVEDELKRTGGE